MTQTHPVAAALAPQKQAAQDRAAQFAAEHYDRMNEALLAAGGDLEVCAPYPKSNVGKVEYMMCLAVRKVYEMYFKGVGPGSRSPRDPNPYVADEAWKAKWVAEARETCGAAFDAYVAKLVGKVGPCDAAEYQGNLWSRSTITVRKGAEVEVWHTQQIINVSSLGKIYNQWPTRKAK